MAEAVEQGEAHEGGHEGAHEGAHGGAHEGHAHVEDPMHHIRDVALVGVDSTTGRLIYKPRNEHGQPVEVMPGVVYSPRFVGPIKLEFTKHMFALTVAALIFFVVSMAVARAVLAGIRGNHAPRGKLANAIEAIVVYVRDEVVAPVGGGHLGHYTPLFINYFLLILICNYLGMVPELGSATGNFGITGALAISVYALIWILGFAHNGFGYVAHLVPPGTPLWLWPLMFILEIVGPIIKCFVLAVRLFANMIAGHLVIANLLSLGKIAGVLMVMGVPLALGISFLEVLVCAIQAYVFTLLAVIFIGGAVHPEH